MKNDTTRELLRTLIKEVWEDMAASNDNSVGDGTVYPRELDSVKAKEVAGVYLVHTRDLEDLLFPTELGPWGLEDEELEEHFKAWADAHNGIYYVSHGFGKQLENELVGAAIDADVGLVVYR